MSEIGRRLEPFERSLVALIDPHALHVDRRAIESTVLVTQLCCGADQFCAAFKVLQNTVALHMQHTKAVLGCRGSDFAACQIETNCRLQIRSAAETELKHPTEIERAVYFARIETFRKGVCRGDKVTCIQGLQSRVR